MQNEMYVYCFDEIYVDVSSYQYRIGIFVEKHVNRITMKQMIFSKVEAFVTDELLRLQQTHLLELCALIHDVETSSSNVIFECTCKKKNVHGN